MDTEIVASYNGLIWWKKELALIPSFVDLEEPNKVYYNAAKSITGVSPQETFQCLWSRAAQFCISESVTVDAGRGDIVDMATGIITTVVPPSHWPSCEDMTSQHATFVDWLDGQFQARMIHGEVVGDLRSEIFEVFGVP